MVDEVVKVPTPQMSLAVTAMQKQLQQNRDIRNGKESIHANKAIYFNKLDDQSDDQFKAMVEMAPVYVLYPRVVDGFVGTVFAKAPNMTEIEFDDKQKEYNKNIDMLGNSVDKYSENVVSQIMENGFCATMNDYSKDLERPFLRLVKPEQFISFRSDSEEGYPQFTQFIFKEDIEKVDPSNEFDTLVYEQYTVLDFSLNKENGDKKNYRVRLYESVNEKDKKSGDASEVILKSTSFPKKDGNFFEKMPLTLHTGNSNNFTIGKSNLQDISDMNISVLQRVVDQVYMLHWTALPTPWITGSDGNGKGDPDSIGPSKIWYIDNPDSKVGMLEFSGNSARAHQDYIENLLFIMATTGAQILKKEGVSRETATSVLVRTASQTSLVATMVDNSSNQLKEALTIQYEWSGVTVSSKFEYKLNKDFLKVDMEPNAQIALVKSWLDGAISHNTLFTKMKEGEIVHPNKTFEEEKAEIAKNPPPFFDKEADAKNAEKVAETAASTAEKVASTAASEAGKLKGSNLENGNVANKQATE